MVLFWQALINMWCYILGAHQHTGDHSDRARENTPCLLQFEFELDVCTHVSKVHCGSAFDQALPGVLITAPQSVCIPAELGEVAVWIKKKTQKPKIQED